jgi:hypothetical protein
MNSAPVVVSALATNFHNQSSSIAVTYLADCGCNPNTQQADGLCNCTSKPCPYPQQMGVDGCCPLNSVVCGGVCLPPGQDCCSNVGVPSNAHCCANPPGTTCAWGYTCCGTSQCCPSNSQCVNGYCEAPFSLTGPFAPRRRIWPPH